MNMIPHYEVFPTKVKFLNNQNGICPLCAQPINVPTDGVLDHDHNTGLIRATLHDGCNKSLGFFEAITKIISPEEATKRMVDYINYHRDNPSNIIHPRQTKLRREQEKRIKKVKIPRLLLTAEEKIRYKMALNEGAIQHPNPKRHTSREGSWNRTALKYKIPYDRLLAYVNKTRSLDELE